MDTGAYASREADHPGESRNAFSVAKIQTDPDELRRYLRNITGAMALIIFPVTVGMALVAPEFVPLILGAKWIGVILPLEILVLHALVRSNVILIVPLLNVIGEERLVMWNSLACMVVLPISFYIGSRWGTAGIATGWVVVYPLLQLPMFARIFRKVHFPRSEYLATMWPAVSGCVVMALSVEAFKWFSGTGWPHYGRVVGGILVGATAYGCALLLMHRNYVRGIHESVRASG